MVVFVVVVVVMGMCLLRNVFIVVIVCVWIGLVLWRILWVELWLNWINWELGSCCVMWIVVCGLISLLVFVISIRIGIVMLVMCGLIVSVLVLLNVFVS